MTTNDLAQLGEKFTSAGIEHLYIPGDAVITVIRGDHTWTIDPECVIYWDGNGIVREFLWLRATTWAADAYSYIADVYSKVK